MDEKKTPHTLIEDLEAIRQSLDKIAESNTHIPTLEEIVGHRAPSSVNTQNPFLASKSLSELIKIRNEAEARAAQELASMAPIKSVEEILAKPQPPTGPDPEEIVIQLESLFETWVENSVSQYLEVFESELRNRVQQDFRELVTRWYTENELPIPESFTLRNSAEDTSSKDQPDTE